MANPDLKAWSTPQGAAAFDKTKHSPTFALSIEEQIELPQVLKVLGNCDGMSVLEMGCGDALVLDEHFGRASKRIGVDGSLSQLQLAKRDPQTFLVAADLTRGLPIASNEVDLAYSRFVFMFLSQLDTIAKESQRVLRENGKLVFTVAHPVYPYIQELTGTPHRYKGMGTYGETNRGSMTMQDHEYPFYFRSVEDYLKPFIQAGLGLTDFYETVVPNETIDNNPQYERMRGRPVYLTVGFVK